MDNNNSAVTKGLNFEIEVEKFLKEQGFVVYRTNKSNPYDPDDCKHGYDGGVDIIAIYRFEHLEFVFYIQCKCWEKELTKTAIAEAYAGMKSRNDANAYSIPVVICTSDASRETMQFAQKLGVELFLNRENIILRQAMSTGRADYGNYGALLKILLYHYTKDREWIDTIPKGRNTLSKTATADELFRDYKISFDNTQACFDNAEKYERKANEERQKGLDIQRTTVFKCLQASGILNKIAENSKEKQTPSNDDDSG